MRTRGWWTATGLLLLLGFALAMLRRPFPAAVGQPLAYAAQALTALAVCGLLVRRARRTQGAVRRARLAIAAALASGAVAGVVALVIHVMTGEPPGVPSIADLVHFGFLPLGVLGLLSYPTRDTAPGSVQRSLLDGAVAALALWFLAYALLLEPSDVGRGLDALGTLTALAYPAADVFVLGTLIGVLPRVTDAVRRELALIGGGFAVYCVSDIAYSVLHTQGTYRADSWVSVVAEVGLVLILAGVLVAPTARIRTRDLGLLAQAPVAGVLVVTAADGLAGGAVGGPLLGVALVMTVTLLARQAVSQRDRRTLTARLRAREELFRSLVLGGSDLITLTDAQGQVLWASPAVSRTVGRQVLEGEQLLASVHPGDRDVLASAAMLARSEPHGQSEVLCRLGSVTGWRWMQVRFQDRCDDPAVGGLICNARDVHESHVLQEELVRAARHDALTGLGNVVRARELLADCYAGRRRATAAVLMVDLDGFKAVNDTFGHALGDALLQQVAHRLQGCLREGDEVLRLGGDEFVLVLADARAAALVGRRVVTALRTPIVVDGASLEVRASVGSACAADAASPDDLLRNADLAMYASKDAGRDRVTAYEPGMHRRVARRMQIHRGLREALDLDLLALHYQPIVSLVGGQVIGAEALLRWSDPDVETTELISVAEETGLIGEVDAWVLERACRDSALWRTSGLPVPRLSVNVSRRQLTAGLPGLVERTLRRHALDGADLCLEVTESAVLADVEVACAALARVRELGVMVALDDFGSGQSSLSQLARLPVDTVKIDMGFTQSAVVDPGARRLLTSIVRVCQSLELPVVAEGIEDLAVAELLTRAGCERGQGWLYGRPDTAERFTEVLAATRWVPPTRDRPDVLLLP